MVDFKQLQSMSQEEREEKLAQFNEERNKEEKHYFDILSDALKYPNLNDWEVGFISSLHRAWISNSMRSKADLSIAQRTSFARIEKKIYST